MSVFEQFKEKVIRVRRAVEEFKDNHKMASEAISLIIDSMPEPFNKLSSVIWNGLEKETKDSTANSSAKLLEILEKIENSTEQSFSEIKTNLSELLQLGAKTEDIQKLGEQIRISNESVIQNLRIVLDNELKKAAQRLEESFKNSLIELHLQESNMRLVTIATEFGVGNKDCWKIGYFRDEDIKNNFDARRAVTEEIIDSIKNTTGTILYGEAHYGKTILLKRIMFEEIEKGYTVMFCENPNINSALLCNLIKEISSNFSNVLVIADNVQKKGCEEVFKTFNHFAVNDPHNIKFLFAARPMELEITRSTLDWEKAAIVNLALHKVNKIDLKFTIDDAVGFIKKAVIISKNLEVLDESAVQVADDVYRASRADPLVYVCGIMYYIKDQNYNEADFLIRDINEKMNLLVEQDLWEAAILCSMMGMLGINLTADILTACNVYTDTLKRLLAIGFLFIKENHYNVRHERWALEFLVHLYKENFANDFISFNARFRIGDLFKCTLDKMNTDNLIIILLRCTTLYQAAERFRPICQLFVDNFVVPTSLTDKNKSLVYCYGLGSFYDKTENYNDFIRYTDKAIELDHENAAAWHNKGTAYYKLESYGKALEFYHKALSINLFSRDTWYCIGLTLAQMKKDETAIGYYDITISLDPNDAIAFNNKGVCLIRLRRFGEAILSLEEAIKIDPNYCNAWQNKLTVHRLLGELDKANRCIDRIAKIDPTNVCIE